MSRIRSLATSRRLRLALLLTAPGALSGCGVGGALTGPVRCDGMDDRRYDWTYELSSDGDRPTLQRCPHGSR
jgi:hypothetical protein